MSADVARRARRLLALGAVALLGACSWFTDFKVQPKFDPWDSPHDSIPMRGNPQNSVPVYGSAVPGFVVSRAAFPATIDSMAGIPNPVPADPRSLRNGQHYFAINCAVCHGFEGKGDGSIVPKGYPGIPLVGPASPAPGRTDGYIWGVIRNGRGLMPSYNRIEELDRWDVVNYLRGLQGRYTVATGPLGLPGETGDKLPGYSQTGPTRPSPYYIRAGSQAGGVDAAPLTDRALAAPARDSAVAAPAAPATPGDSAPRSRAGVTPAPPTTTPNTGGVR